MEKPCYNQKKKTPNVDRSIEQIAEFSFNLFRKYSELLDKLNEEYKIVEN